MLPTLRGVPLEVVFGGAVVLAGRPRRGPRASACPTGPARHRTAHAGFAPSRDPSPPRVFRSNRGRDGVLKENTARPDIRQPERATPRVLIGSGMPSKCFRTVLSIPGIERCLRKGFLSFSRPVSPVLPNNGRFRAKSRQDSVKKFLAIRSTYCRT